MYLNFSKTREAASKLVLFLVIGILCAFTRPAIAATYSVSELLPTPLDVPAVVNTISWENTDTSYPNDDDQRLVSISFPFTFKDVTYTQVRVLTNGVLHFGADERFHRVYSNSALPTNSADRFIAPYWDDLVDDAQSSVTYGEAGSAPFRSFIVTWNNVRAYANNQRYDFQVVLYENGDIRFRYANNTANGISATIGIEVDNSDFTQYSFNTESVRTDFDLYFRNTLLNLPPALLDIRMDEPDWTGAVNEVQDVSGNQLHGTVLNGAKNSDSSPALSGNPGTCRHAEFNGSNHYINVPHNSLLDLTGSFTVGVWVKINSLPGSGLKTILSKDENYEFHIKPNGAINWWWQTTSPNATRQFDSTGRVTPGRWTHVAIRFQANNQHIFIDGVASGSATFTGTPRANTDPLQFGSDQGFGGRYFNGMLDEVRIFNTALSDAQMVTLATETHFCVLANPGCSAAFPDALSSYSDGVLTFNESGNQVNSPDNQLQFGSISPASNTFCNSQSCVADPANPATDIDFGTFPVTSGFTQDLTINNNQTDTLGNASQTQYRNVSVGQNATMNVNTSQSTYYIDDLRIRQNAVVNLQPGDYWVRRLRVERNVRINVVGSGTARLLIRDDVVFQRDTWLNANDGFGLTGDPGKLLLFAEGNLTFQRNIRSWAAIFAKGDITLERDGLFDGGITASNISIDRNTTINYDGAAMTRVDFGNLCQGGSCTFGGFQITQPPVALACPQTRASISYQALCDDGATPKTDYAGSLSFSSNEPALSQFYLNSTGGSAITNVNLTGSESGAGIVYLYHQNENNDLRVSLTDQASGITSTAVTGTDFRTSGFSVSGPGNFACGTNSNLTLSAIGQDNNLSGACSLLTGFTGSKNISAWLRVNYDVDELPEVTDAVASPYVMNGTAISASVQPATANLTLNFTAGQSTINLQHLDASHVLSMEFAHDDGLGATPELRGSSSSFVVTPHRLQLSAPDAASACVSGDHTCSAFVKAGADFDMRLSAQCADASSTIARSYQTPVAQPISLNLNLVAPLPTGVNGTLGVNQLAVQAIDNGVTTVAQQVSEVGVFTISGVAPDYFLMPVVVSPSVNIGRFYPDHFDLTLTAADFTNSCNSFTYLDQDFYFNTAPRLRIEAKNTNDQLTRNYEAGFWRLGSALQEQGTCNGVSAVKGFCYSDNVAGLASLRAPNSSQSYGDISNINGQLELLLHDQVSDAFRYQRPVSVNIPPFDADIRLTVEIDDGEAMGMQSLNNIGFATDLNAGGSDYNLTNERLLRHGRWKMENAFGPETESLAIKAHAQYYTLQNRFDFNPDDTCTMIPDSAIATSPVGTGMNHLESIAVGSGTSDFSFNSPLLPGVDENFILTSPGAGNVGNVMINVDLSSHFWLQFDWDQNGSLDNHPAINASFGQFRGHDKIIYWREVRN